MLLLAFVGFLGNAEDVFSGFFGSRCRPNNHLRVVFKFFHPTLDVGNRVFECFGIVKICFVAQNAAAILGNQLFTRVKLIPECRRLSVALSITAIRLQC